MWSLWGRSPCGGLNSLLDNWSYRLKLCFQKGQQEGVKHVSPKRLRNPNAKTKSPSAQVWTFSGASAEEILQLLKFSVSLPYPCSLHTFPLLLQPLSTSPMGTYLDRMEFFPIDSLFKRYNVRIQVHAIFITPSWTCLASRALTLKLPTALSESFFQNLRLRNLSWPYSLELQTIDMYWEHISW